MAFISTAVNFTFYAADQNLTHLYDMTVRDRDECPDFFEMPVEGARRAARATNETRYDLSQRALSGRPVRRPAFTPRPSTAPTRRPASIPRNARPRRKLLRAAHRPSDIPPADGRRIQIAWMFKASYPGMPFNQQMSFPGELTLHRTPEAFARAAGPCARSAAARHRGCASRCAVSGWRDGAGGVSRYPVAHHRSAGAARRGSWAVRSSDQRCCESTIDLSGNSLRFM